VWRERNKKWRSDDERDREIKNIINIKQNSVK
jgi:hypothetical protein